jgi:hypothetical protein
MVRSPGTYGPPAPTGAADAVTRARYRGEDDRSVEVAPSKPPAEWSRYCPGLCQGRQGRHGTGRCGEPRVRPVSSRAGPRNGSRRGARRKEGAGCDLCPPALRSARGREGAGLDLAEPPGRRCRGTRRAGVGRSPGEPEPRKKRGGPKRKKGVRTPGPGGAAGTAPKSGPGAAAGVKVGTNRGRPGGGGTRGWPRKQAPGPGGGRRDRSEETILAPAAGDSACDR